MKSAFVRVQIEHSEVKAMQKSLKELREAAGLTQLQVAYELGVTPQTVYMWESGRRDCWRSRPCWGRRCRWVGGRR